MIILCQFYFVGSVPVEPMCSKFSYDEQLLEKMVRMEFFVENMKKDVESSVSNVNDEIIDIKGNNSELSIKLSEQQGKIDNLERQTGVFGVTMANKSVVSDNTSKSTIYFRGFLSYPYCVKMYKALSDKHSKCMNEVISRELKYIYMYVFLSLKICILFGQ